MITVPVDARRRPSYPCWSAPAPATGCSRCCPPGVERAAVVTQAGIGVDVDPGVEHRTFTHRRRRGGQDLGTVEDLCRAWARWGLTRGDVVVAVGGGVVTDTAGFAAAVYHRGVPVVHVPTTLLGQVDAAIGGKTGVNLPEGKNLVGAFWQPAAVLCDTEVLATLPPREYRSGLGEMAKYAFLGVDGLPDLPLDEAVAACVRCKAEVVAADERERTGRRALLNYGHTLAHALETAGGYDLRHGEAVAIGLVYAARLARAPGPHRRRRGWPSTARVVAGYDLPIDVPPGADPERAGRRSWAGTRRRSTGSRSCSTAPAGVEVVAGVDRPTPSSATLEESGRDAADRPAAVGPEPEPAGRARAEIYGTATLADHVGHRHGRGRRPRAATSSTCSPTTRASWSRRSTAPGAGARPSSSTRGAFTHYAWSLHDALAAFDGPVVELHLSNPDAREPWRHTSVVAPVATGTIAGFGGDGYRLAVEAVAAAQARMTSSTSPDGRRRPLAPAARRSSADAGCDALLVTNLVNIRYLTGFTGSAAAAAGPPDELVFVTDGRYGEQAADAAGRRRRRRPRIEIGLHRAAADARAGGGRAAGVAALGLEADAVTWAAPAPLRRRLVPGGRAGRHRGPGRGPAAGEGRRRGGPHAEAGPDRRRRPGRGRPPPGREADRGGVRPRARHRDAPPGRRRARRFETIVASGPNGAKPHHRPSDRHDRSTASWWCSTSAPWSTATTPT